MTKFKRHLLLVLLISLSVSFILFASSITAKTDKNAMTKIYIYPQKASYPKLEIGDVFITNVKIDNVDNLYAYEFKLKYNPEILEFVSIDSSFLNNAFSFKKTETGIIRYAAVSTYPAEPKSGDGILATITFRVKNKGSSILDIYGEKLIDYNMNPVEHSVKDGYFTTGEELEMKSEFEKVQITQELFFTPIIENVIQTNFGSTQTTMYSTDSCIEADIDSDYYTNYTLQEAECKILDCDDNNPLSYPNAPEICDRKDNDCDGHKDEPDVCLPGDVDHQISQSNYSVDVSDLAPIGKAYGSSRGQQRYDECVNATRGSYCDLNDDGLINIFDLAKVGKNYGNTQLACVVVTIHVQDSNGTPIRMAYVEIKTSSDDFLENGPTDIDGNYETCLEDDEYKTLVIEPTGGWKELPFSVPIYTYILVEPPWNPP